MLDYRLYLTYRDCGHVTEQLLKTAFGINRRRWRILATVQEMEGCTLNMLAERAELDNVQASRTVGTMVREGYLKRLSSPGNARFASIVFTDKGRALHDLILERYRAANIALVDAFSVAEVCELDRLLAKLRSSLLACGTPSG